MRSQLPSEVLPLELEAHAEEPESAEHAPFVAGLVEAVPVLVLGLPQGRARWQNQVLPAPVLKQEMLDMGSTGLARKAEVDL